ncbi:Jag N-terminal domain-containing protein [Campylobacter sp. VBCF_06 NA8]|uniref:Jag N-terminal domain-containing protein n=1 Tax=unclassified Campylobacter TaxID=2593542 RepID=UPI0022E9B22F|nr:MULTISPECIES: Jag N-terminal domain-containing protein [unclassified Campylobacter]MDA3046283.1 Jag N-terminal domain-containing protein [Campylobacter sp. VBCF_06 NA8]MDA3076646.1 Jag N-terminal domain-containing protein [Campylobacter sp. JMF_04 NA10]
MKIEAINLTQAYQKAADEFGCSITELNIRVIQQPSSGFLGFFKKNAIIEVVKKGEKFPQSENLSQKPNDEKKPQNSQKTRSANSHKVRKEKPKAAINDEICKDIEQKITNLIAQSGFNLSVCEVKIHDENSVYIKIDGDDSALLIGKEGHRYKAFSYMIYNWISMKYNLSVVFEVAEFLQNQSKHIDSYVGALKANANGSKIVTKPFDGAFVKIASDKIKESFPDRTIGIKSTRNGKIIIIDEKN